MKKFVFSLLILLSALAAKAQDNAEQGDEFYGGYTQSELDSINNRPAHYLVFDVGGGLHFLTYDIDDFGSKKPGYGFMGRAGYRFFFNRHWGIGTELNLKTYSTSATLDYIQEIENAVDEENGSYLHRTYFNGLKEKQKQTSFNIPLGVYYQTQLGRRWKAQGGLGIFYQFSELSNKFTTTDGSLETRGYYDEFNVELFGMDQHHFYTADDFEGDYEKKSCLGLFAEGNLLFQLTHKLELDLGLYFSYGLNYQNEKVAQNIYDPDCMMATAYSNAKYNGVLASEAVEKSHPMAVGLMAGIRYRLGNDPYIKNRPGDGDDDDHSNNTPTTDSTTTNVPDSTNIPGNDIPDIDTNGDNGDNGGNVDEGTGNDDGGNVDEGTGNDGGDDDGGDNTSNRTERDKRTPGEVLVDDLKKFNKVAVNFAFNDTHINATPIQKDMFDKVATFMKENSKVILHIVGHTCNIGTLQQNKIVGQRRADATKQEMLNRGVPADRITTESKAYLEPLVPNTSEENRKKNRRIEFSITVEE